MAFDEKVEGATAIYCPRSSALLASYLGIVFMRLSGFRLKLVSNFDQGEIEEGAVYT